MAELFNAEQYRQQMGEQAAQGQAGLVQGQPQPYQPQQMQQPQIAQTQIVPPNPYQPQEYAPQPYPQYQPQLQQAAQPHMPPQEWAPQHQHMQQPHLMQPQTPMHHMPEPAVFAPPPGTTIEVVEEAPKASRFKRKRAAKVKTPRVKKSKAETSEAVHTSKTSPAIIFMFGMATGIVAFLVGNMLMSNLLADDSAKSFRDIESQNAQAQQPVLPQSTKKSAENIEG